MRGVSESCPGREGQVLLCNIWFWRPRLGSRLEPAPGAAHIKPYSETGTHLVSNGILLRRDLHALFDKGYVTITPAMRVEVSRTIREEFENGRDYYRHHERSGTQSPIRRRHGRELELCPCGAGSRRFAPRSLCDCQRLDGFDVVTDCPRGIPQVDRALGVEPELGGVPDELRQTQRQLGA